MTSLKDFRPEAARNILQRLMSEFELANVVLDEWDLSRRRGKISSRRSDKEDDAVAPPTKQRAPG
jgi:hypothetical protein